MQSSRESAGVLVASSARLRKIMKLLKAVPAIGVASCRSLFATRSNHRRRRSSGHVHVWAEYDGVSPPNPFMHFRPCVMALVTNRSLAP